MKSLITILLFLLLSAHGHEKITNLEYNLQIEQVTSDSFIITDKDYYWSNTLITKLNDGTVFLSSSPYENKSTETLLKWINKEFKPKKIIAINTHFHLDGTGGNEMFHKYGVETWASDLTGELQFQNTKIIEETSQYYKNPDLLKRVKETKIVTAKNIFKLKEGKIFKFPDEEIQVFFPGHAHSADNLIVYFKHRKIMFGGCMIKAGKDLGYLRDASVKNWAHSVQKLLKFDIEIIVPGHGRYGNKDLITKTVNNALKTALCLLES